MNKRTSRLITGTLAGILAIIPITGGCSNKDKANPPQRVYNQQDVNALLTEIEQLKNKAKESEEKGYDPKNPAYLMLERENCSLKTKNAELEYCIAHQELRIREQGRDKSRLELKLDEDKIKLQRIFVNSSKNYPFNGFQELLEEKNISYDKEKIKESWNNLNTQEREAFYLSYLDPDLFYQSFSHGKKARYDEFLKRGLTKEEIKTIQKTTGFKDDITRYKSPISLAAFHTQESINLPPVR